MHHGVQGEDQKRLLHLLSPEGLAEHKAWHQQSRCVLELMREFPHVQPPLGKHQSPAACPLGRTLQGTCSGMSWLPQAPQHLSESGSGQKRTLHTLSLLGQCLA